MRSVINIEVPVSSLKGDSEWPFSLFRLWFGSCEVLLLLCPFLGLVLVVGGRVVAVVPSFEGVVQKRGWFDGGICGINGFFEVSVFC